MENFIRIDKFAKMAGVNISKIRRLGKQGILIPAKMNGTQREYTLEQLELAKKFQRKPKLLEDGYNLIDENIKFDAFDSYFAGLFYSDGSLYKDGAIGLSLKDKDLLDELITYFNSIPIVKKHKTRPMYSIYLGNNYNRTRFKDFNFVQRKTYGFDIPKMNKESFCHCLRGWFDGDGSASVRTKGKRIGCVRINIAGCKYMLSCIQKTLFETFGLYMIWADDKRHPNFGILEINKLKDISLFFDILYGKEGVYLKRKKKVLEDYLKLKGILK